MKAKFWGRLRIFLFFGYVIGAAVVADQVKNSTTLTLLLILLGLLFLIPDLIFWRCPNCNRYLGNRVPFYREHFYCPFCGAEIEDE